MANWQVASVLFRNDGNGDFTRVIDGPMGSNIGRSLSCAWGDYDHDGFLDLLVANRGQNPFFYRNNGDATFAQILTGPIPTLGGGCSFLWSDYDNDGALDLFFIPGFTGASSRLFHNDGAGSLSPVNEGTFVGDGQGGCDWGDYDNDGWLDLFVTHYKFGSPHDGPNNFLFRNNRDGTFARIIRQRIVQDGGNSIGCAWADYDNDGFLDAERAIELKPDHSGAGMSLMRWLPPDGRVPPAGATGSTTQLGLSAQRGPPRGRTTTRQDKPLPSPSFLIAITVE